MGQKINPTLFRSAKTRFWESKWTSLFDYKDLAYSDILLRIYVARLYFCNELLLSNVFIRRSTNSVNVSLYTHLVASHLSKGRVLHSKIAILELAEYLRLVLRRKYSIPVVVKHRLVNAPSQSSLLTAKYASLDIRFKKNVLSNFKHVLRRRKLKREYRHRRRLFNFRLKQYFLRQLKSKAQLYTGAVVPVFYNRSLGCVPVFGNKLLHFMHTMHCMHKMQQFTRTVAKQQRTYLFRSKIKRRSTVSYRRSSFLTFRRKKSRFVLAGAMLSCSGRLSRSGMASTKWHREGSIPRQTVVAKLDYNLDVVTTDSGAFGNNVWLHYKSLYF